MRSAICCSRQGTFTRTFRALSFAQTVSVLELLAFYPPVAPAVRAVTLVVSMLAVWMAAATAHNLRGWRAAVLPLVVVFVYLLGGVLVYSLATGASLTWQTLVDAVGLTPQMTAACSLVEG